MKTVVTELLALAFLFIWISLCCGRVLLTGGYRPSFCSLPKETGVCRGAFPRWYYNINSDKCERFTYGGCGGNKNNFDTRNECEGNCTTNTGKEGDPSQLPELFVGKNARITDKTIVMFRRQLRRDLNSTSSSINNNNQTSKEIKLVNKSNNVSNKPTVRPSQGELSSQTLSSSSKRGTRAPDLTHEDSSGPTSNEANVVNLPEKGDNAANPTTPLPTKSQSESPSQTKSSSSKPGTRAPDLTREDSSGPTSSEANVVNLPENGANAAKPTTPLPAKSQGESSSQTLSSSSKLGAPAPDLTPENSPDEINSERQLASRGGSKGNDGKSETLSQGKKEQVKSDVKSNKLQGNNARPFHRKGEPIEKTESPPRHPDESSGKTDGLPFQPNELTNEDLDDLDFPHLQTSRKDSAAYPYEHTSSHFAAFFLTSIVMVFAAYVVYHNRQKIIAIVIEGRSDGNGRRRGYRKLETNVEEAMPSLKSSNSTYVY